MMAGFIDVTGWSARQVQRLGHEDDDTPEQPRSRGVRVTAGGGHPGYPVADVWAAACAAQRVNGEYVKETQRVFDKDTGLAHDGKRRNRDVMTDFVNDPAQLLPEDYTAGAECQNFLRNDLTFRALKGRLTEFDQATSKVLAVADRFFPQQHKYELAVIACLPQSHQRSLSRQEQQARMQRARGGIFGTVGDKVAMTVEIVSASYSQHYGIWWTTAVNDADQPVIFSYRTQLQAGERVDITGTVKGHRDNRTQLNRVKIV